MPEAADEKENLDALLFLTLGSKYLNLVRNVLNETIRSGNPHIISSSSVSNSSEMWWKEYFEKTKWSDFMIIEPILFNFYQGLELTLKGLLFLTNQTDIKAEHKIENLYQRVTNMPEIPQDLKDVIKTHIVVKEDENPLIYNFLTENNKSIGQLYESLRYPSDKHFNNLTKYFDLHYQEEKSLEYFKKVIEDIRKLQALCTSFYRNTTKTGFGGVTSR